MSGHWRKGSLSEAWTKWLTLCRSHIQRLFMTEIGCKYIQILLNSLAPGRPGCHFKTTIFDLVLLIGIFTLSNNNALRWMPWDLTDDKSTFVQVMAWCRQATSHYLNQCWHSSMSSYGVTRPQWVKLVPEDPIDSKSALLWVMAWPQTGSKPLPEPMMTQVTDA